MMYNKEIKSVSKLAEEIISGRRVSRKDNLSILVTANIEELCLGANLIRKALCGDKADLCTIINGRSGRCPENCKFCAQSSFYQTGIEKYSFLDVQQIIEEGKRIESAGVQRYSIVTAGRSIKGYDLEQVLVAYRRLSVESNLKLCASHGLQTVEDFLELKKAGVERYHCNLETSRRYFPEICTTHTYDDKVENIKRAQKVGLDVCSGGIIGMGETWDDRIDMALNLAELEIKSIPLNILRPIQGTPFEKLPALSVEDILRTVAIFRYINPSAWIRMAAGRDRFVDGGAMLFESGANSAITGDMLTTTGTKMAEDRAMLGKIGYKL